MRYWRVCLVLVREGGCEEEKVVVVSAKAYAAEVPREAMWVDGVFVRTLALSIEQHFVEMPVLLPHCHLEGVQLAGYIQGLFYPCS